MSIATLLSQHHQVTAVDIIPEKVDMINNRKSPIQDDYIPLFMLSSIFNVVVGLYSVIYVALKKTKEIAKTSIYAGISNNMDFKN